MSAQDQNTNTNQNTELNITTDNATTITVNVGTPGNLKKVILQGKNPTVADALRAAELKSDGREIRMSGEKANLTDPVYDGRTILLFQAVRGN